MKANIFQIPLDESARSGCDAGFVALAETNATYAEWGEYPAIRNFFQNYTSIGDELYGFFAADFKQQTGLSAEQVYAFIADNPGYEVYSFSSAGQDGACHVNVFEQANVAYPGFVELASLCLKRIGIDLNLEDLVMDARSTVVGPTIVAHPSFWQTWFPLTEKLHEILDDRDAELDAAFTAVAQQVVPDTLKRALVDRFAALVLALCPDIAVRGFDVLTMPWSNAAMRPYANQITFLNELKSGYVKSNNRADLTSFFKLRGAILKACEGERLSCAADGFMTTAQLSVQDLLYVCYTHVELPFEYPSFVMPIYLGQSQREGRTNLRDLAPEWEPYHPQLGSLAGCFALKNYIVRNGLQLRRVAMCQYRKFVSTSKIGGVPAPNYSVMDVIGKHILTSTHLAKVMLPGNDDLLIGQYYALEGGCLSQYCAAHPVEDLLRFVSEAIELGVLGQHEIAAFFDTERFVPGGIEMGVFPAAFWVEAITTIERVVLACVKHDPTTREGYQARRWAFCVERLGSHLLLKYIAERYGTIDDNAAFIGQLNLYNSDESTVYAVGSAT
ncbi:hypothetical protein [Paraburkholderia sp.]|jgi:hypothetical protein|uniref:hypothetical protein n=1 Tax=Paraburkholderia sp. TaxID=1926495 RepID=UPI00260AD869|nr:hypothetical protein [Paraburkholderia sp.]